MQETKQETKAPASLRAVVFDWAGTVIDFGSQAPMGAFVRLFANHGVEISIAEARQPMGLPKWDHIQALGRLPRVAAAWQAAHDGQPMSEADVDALYAEFTPMNAASVLQHAQLIDGVPELVAELRRQGLKVGSTTGYNRPIMQVMAPLAAAQGFAPDNLVCADDLPHSRPSPLAMYRCFVELGVWPAWQVVKVDDTLPGLLEGRNAGCWCVAVLVSGNEVGLSAEQWAALPEPQRAALRKQARSRLAPASPDYVVDTVADLLPILEDINARLAWSERPDVG
jgi:phosphonoacetaldehyde hydrolase